jgi:uncharacterized membrane protein YphA (DoxX/SURF4 family)
MTRDDYLLLIGRILFGAFFVFAGYGHFANAEGLIGGARAGGVFWAPFFVYLTGIMLILGGGFVIFNFLPRAGLALILLFLIPAAFIMHDFWTFSDPDVAAAQLSSFLRNMSLSGAALMLWPLWGAENR